MQVFSKQSVECVQKLQLPGKFGLIFINGRPRECSKHQNIQRKKEQTSPKGDILSLKLSEMIAHMQQHLFLQLRL